jgi:hypothetical protein
LIFEFRGYEWFEDRLVAVASSKFSGKQFTVIAARSSSDSALEIFDQKSALVSRIKTPAGFQIVLGGGEFTGDGVGDFATVDWAKNQLVVYRGNDKGQFVPHQQIGITFEDDRSRPKSHGVVADFNNDGLSDIALLQPSSGRAQFKDSDVLGIYLNQKGRLVLSDTVILGSDEYTDISTGDLNKDGFSDLVLVGSGNGSLKIALSQKGVFTSAGKLTQEFDLSGIYKPDHVRIGDINNDGNQDLVFGSENSVGSGLIQTFLGNGSGAFTDAQILSKSIIGLGRFQSGLDSWTVGFELKDVNQDKQLDLILRSGRTYLNVSNVVDGSEKYNFRLITSLDVNSFSEDYNSLGIPFKQRFKFDPKTTVLNSSVDGSTVTIVGPNTLTTFDSRSGVVPQITVQNSNHFTASLEQSASTRYLDTAPPYYLGSRTDLPRLDWFRYDYIKGNNAVEEFFIGNSAYPHSDGGSGGYVIDYSKGDRLFFNEPGTVQLWSTVLVKNYDPMATVRLLWTPLSANGAVDPTTGLLIPLLGVSSVDIRIPLEFVRKKGYENFSKIDSVSDLNDFLEDKNFVNLLTNKLTEGTILNARDAVTSTTGIFDASIPVVISPEWGYSAYGSQYKFDTGDRVDMSWLLHLNGILSNVVAQWNKLVAENSSDLVAWFESYRLGRPDLPLTWTPEPLVLRNAAEAEFRIGDYYHSASDFSGPTSEQMFFNGLGRAPLNETTSNYSMVEIEYLKSGVPAVLNHGNTVDYTTDAEYMNFFLANEYLAGTLWSPINLSPGSGSIHLFFDKRQFEAIDEVHTFQELIDVIGVSSFQGFELTNYE